MYKTGYLIALSFLLFTACQNSEPQKIIRNKLSNQNQYFLKLRLIKEAFTTLRDESDNVDSPAIWHGEDGQNWLLATAKEGNVLLFTMQQPVKKLPGLANWAMD
jgi:hypothetical protein